MSKVYFIGDLHFGHKNICNIRNEFKSSAEHDQFVFDTWNDKVKKQDLVFVLGDVAFTKEALEMVGGLTGRKILVKGNHDKEDIHRYLMFFEDIVGVHPYKDETGRYWLSHAPIHAQELRGRINIHGHTHHNVITKSVGDPEEDGDWINDDRYFNTSCENVNYEPRTTKELQKQNIPVVAEPVYATEPASEDMQNLKLQGPDEGYKILANFDPAGGKYFAKNDEGKYKWVSVPKGLTATTTLSNTSETGDIPQ